MTGAASGIGHAAALAFARAGASVVVADLAEEANQRTASLIEQEVKAAAQTSEEEWDRIIAINLRRCSCA